MAENWKTVKATDVRPGDTVRIPSGAVVIASRIDKSFLGMPNMVAFIEDTPERWFKQPMLADGEVEVSS
jgi:hypothetical protein